MAYGQPCRDLDRIQYQLKMRPILAESKLIINHNDTHRLAALCRELDQRGIRWAVSNSDTPFTRELFHGYCATPVDARREINLNSQDRNISELLFTNYEVNRPSRIRIQQTELLLK